MVATILVISLFVYLLFFRPAAQCRRLGRKSSKRAGLAVDRHMETLAKRRRRLVYTDDYGHERVEKWHRELKEFINLEALIPPLPEKFELATTVEDLIGQIDRAVQEYIASNAGNETPTLAGYRNDMDPFEYEHLCAALMNEGGWKAYATVGSGDQGVDVVAERGSAKLVVQCKLYDSPVGNKAVQEVVAGRLHYKATHAAVVTNSDYTRSARELANSAGVFLLHHEDLDDLIGLVDRN